MTLWTNNNHEITVSRGVAAFWAAALCLVIATPLYAQEEEGEFEEYEFAQDEFEEFADEEVTEDEEMFLTEDDFAYEEFAEDEEMTAFTNEMIEQELAMEAARRRGGVVDELSKQTRQAFRDVTRGISKELRLDSRRLGKGDAYWVVRGGMQSDDDVNYNGGMGYLAHGVRLGGGFFRTELEIGYGEARVEKKQDDLVGQDYELRNRNLSVFVNGYFDVASRAINYVVPYVGIGFGYIHAESTLRAPEEILRRDLGANSKHDLHAIGLSAMAGFSLLVGEFHHLDLGYRAVRTSRAPDVEDWHEARIGFSRSFVSDW